MWTTWFFIAVSVVIFNWAIRAAEISAKTDNVSPWKWTCEQGACKKIRNDPESREPALSLEACKTFCSEYGLLWPSPTGAFKYGNFLSKLNIESFNFHNEKSGTSDELLNAAVVRFRNLVKMNIPNGVNPQATGKTLEVYFVNKNPNIQEFSLNMDEGYSLSVHPSANDKINATIKANTFFGIRHGLETLSQVIFYDDLRDHLLIVRDVTITDKPAFPYRGILLDTSRSYFPVQSILSTLDAMAAVKLNSFHWHITDSHSFPFVSERRPALSKLGAYSPRKVYTREMIEKVVQYGLERGIRVIPEFDAPAHVGEGWQDTDLTVCFNVQPWQQYCVEPPCGQLNPIRDELYEYLEDIYKDMAVSFTTTDLFHMGGDEVSEKCWSSYKEIQDFVAQERWLNSNGTWGKESFMKLWDYFQKKAQEKAYMAFGKKVPLILWTSSLTNYEHVDKYLDKDAYIIQVWTTGEDPQIKGLLKKGYRLILSNYDALYFDCGYGAWIGKGNNWCSPYIGWQNVYENIPLSLNEDYKDLILGAEATLWSEQADGATLDGRLWPRAAAMAEKLWANPQNSYGDVVQRMLHVRERLVRMGLQPEVLQPEFCYQNEGQCY